jgi:surface protein
MFGDARAFNQPVGSWNTAKVTNTNGTFFNAYAFNQDNSAWNTSNVTNMDTMFANATSFNKAIGAWNTSKVTTMASMFNGAAAFNQNIIGWNVSNVVTQPPTNFVTSATVFDSTKQPIWITLDGNGTTIKYSGGLISANPTFVQAKPRGSGSGLEWFAIVINDAVAKTMITNYAKNDASPAATAAIASFKPPGQSSPVPFNNIITSLMLDMSSLFSSVSAFNQPIGSWDTSKVTNMSSMFYYASAFNQPIGSWNTSNVTNMSSMFYYASAFNQYITSWNVNNVNLFNTFKQSSNLTDPNTPTNFLNPPTLSFPSGRIPITPIFYDNVVNKVVTITRPVSTSSGGFTYSASVKTVKLDATNYSNTISGVTVSTDGNQDCTLTIPKNNTSFINRIGLIATQSSTSYHRQGSVEYPIDIDVINTASDQVFLHSTKFNVINSVSTGYVWMACLGEVQSVSSILGFSFQCFGSFSNPINQTIKVTVSVSNPTSAWENAVSTEAETTITFRMTSGSGMDGNMTFIPFSPSLLANNPSYVVSNIVYTPPGGLNSVITSYLGTLQPGCYLKMSIQRIDPVLAFGEYWGNIQVSNNGEYFYYITGSLVIYNQSANNAGELSSPQTTPNPNDLTYTASRIVFSDTVSNMLSRMGMGNSWNSLMFTYVRINPIEFTNNNQGYPQYPMDLKLELTIWGLDTANYGYKLYYMTIEFQVQAAYVFSNPLNIHFNLPAPGTKGSIDMKDAYGYYIKTCRGFGNGITIVWGINGINSITRNTTNQNMLTTSSSYPFVNKQIRVSFIGGNTQPDNTTILDGKVDITLSTTNNQNQFRPQNVGWAYSTVALKGW